MKKTKVLFLFLLILGSGSAYAELDNGGFETGFLTYWNILKGSRAGVSAPKEWDPPSGDYEGRISCGAGSPDVGYVEAVFGMPAGTFDELCGENAVNGSVIYRELNVKPGDVLRFKWAFSHYAGSEAGNHFAFLIIDDTPFLLANNSSSFVNSYGSYERTEVVDYEYQFQEEGVIKVGFGSMAVDSIIYAASLQIDDVEFITKSGSDAVPRPKYPIDVPVYNAGSDTDSDGMSDSFEEYFNLDKNQFDEYRRIELRAGDWVPSVTSESYGTIYKATANMPEDPISDLVAGQTLVVHLVFSDPLVVQSLVPEDFYIGFKSPILHNPAKIAGYPQIIPPKMFCVGLEMDLRFSHLSSYDGTIEGVWAEARDQIQLKEADVLFEAVFTIEVPEGYDLQPFSIENIHYQCNKADVQNPDATYADFPVRALVSSEEDPELNISIGDAKVVSFDALAGYIYEIQASKSASFNEYSVVRTLVGTGERTQLFFATDRNGRFFRVSIVPLQ